MRKKIFSLALILGLFGGVLLVSCDKDEQNSPIEPDLSKKATIKGLVHANLTERNDTLPNLPGTGIQLEAAPEGTRIQFKINADQYAAGASGTFIHSTTVGSDGSYEIEIPVTNQGVNIEITPIDFEYEKVVGNWTWDGENYVWEGTTERRKYLGGITVVFLNTGEVGIVDLQYNDI